MKHFFVLIFLLISGISLGQVPTGNLFLNPSFEDGSPGLPNDDSQSNLIDHWVEYNPSADWLGPNFYGYNPIPPTPCAADGEKWIGFYDGEVIGQKLSQPIQAKQLVRTSFSYGLKKSQNQSKNINHIKISFADDTPELDDGNDCGIVNSVGSISSPDIFVTGLEDGESGYHTCDWSKFDSEWFVIEDGFEYVTIHGSKDKFNKCGGSYYVLDNISVQSMDWCSHPCMKDEPVTFGGFRLPAGYIANQFSPNGDGSADYYYIEFSGGVRAKLTVWLRNGRNLVRKWLVPNGFQFFQAWWDGAGENGKMLPSDTYFADFRIYDCEDQEIFQRFITLYSFDATGPPVQPDNNGYDALNTPHFREDCLCEGDDIEIIG